MRRYGDIGNVYFVKQGFCIYGLAFKYKLTFNGENSLVYANNMTELREEIRKLSGESFNEQEDHIQVPPMHDTR